MAVTGHATYRLPWPGGRAVFCASHQGRLDTPHSGRGKYALDFMLPLGTPILAARGGVVHRSETQRDTAYGGDDFETVIEIDHGDGTYARYYHVRATTVRVRPGDRVRQGDELARSGRTGLCQSRHLHFEVVRKAKWKWAAPTIYRSRETEPVDFEETLGLRAHQMTDRWLVSKNKETGGK
jgi:murein DD-endopeptidase MepM/ murein hydrolase activator NlpD